MAKSKGVKNLQSNDGLILTIDSDSDEDVDVRTNLKKKTEEDDENEISPDFKFVADGDDVIQDFNGWDFKVENKHDNRSVDLDGILKRKGGLSGLVNADDEVGDEVDSDEGSEEGSMKSKQSNEDDELALDGFGMGFKNEEESGQNLDENDDSQEQGPSQENNKTSETDAAVVSEDDYHEDEKDSEEAISQFYSSDGIKGLYTNFQSLQLSRPLLKGLAYLGYVKPSPIQSSAIPIALLGKDIVAGAVTGSGKTAAYMIPIIERLIYKPAKVSSTRVIVLTPTRELAIQVSDVGKKIGRFVNNLSFGLAVGGLNLRQQEQQLKSRPDIVFATPGRLIDHIRNSPSFSIESLEILVIDEADRMLEEGFQAELTEILTLIPKHKRQTLLFSATMNTKIKDLIQLSLDRPVRIIIDPPKATSSKLIEEFVRIRKRDHLKAALLFELLKQVDPSQRSRIVVFVSRKETAHNLRIILGFLGLRVSELHGSLSQEQRLKSVSDFKSLEVPVLICTDLAARGLDIPKIEIVINYDMPKTHEIYLHRVGRTARAGREGKAITFVGESSQDRAIVKETLKSLESKKKAVSRNVDWSKVEVSNSVISSKGELIKEVLEEEKQEKEIIQAEMQLHKASNLLEHEKEIHSRPKRTWFEDKSKSNKSEIMQKLTNRGKKVNSKKRKTIEAVKEGPKRVYKKTRKDRMDTKRPPSIKKKKRN